MEMKTPMRTLNGMNFLLLAATLLPVSHSLPAQAPPRLDYYRVANGFIAETKNSEGWAVGTGFAAPNRWGQYTAYLMLTDSLGRRTWRIEHYLPNPDGKTAQGSTMYLLEGSKLALLIDTANPAKFTLGVDDLKTVVRYLLAHENDGSPRAHPLDFVVANTHSHPDHIGENALMSDRTVYYMDLDWPAQAPANYVPIREGGGPTNHGTGVAASQIELGDRLISAVAIPPHTAGSTGYLDTANRLLFSGDALGSGWPWIQWGPLSQFRESVHHVEQVTRPYPDIAVLPAHFYQVAALDRGKPPLNGRPLDRQYITDMAALADGVLSGQILGEPYMAGNDTYWAKYDSAQLVYALATLYRPGEAGTGYHAVHIPGNLQSQGSALGPSLQAIAHIPFDLYLIRDSAGESLYLLRGSQSALLIGAGCGAPGLDDFLRPLVGGLPLDVAVLDRDPRQAGGLVQLHPRHIYVAASEAVNGFPVDVLVDGAVLDLGLNRSGKPLRLEASTFQSDGIANLALLDAADQVLFGGNALEKHEPPRVFGLKLNPAEDQAARTGWLEKMNGRFDLVYLASNSRYFSAPRDLAGWIAAQAPAPAAAH